MTLEINMNPGPDPSHEAAYAGLRKLIQSNKAFLDGILGAKTRSLGDNFKVNAVRVHKDIVWLRTQIRNNSKFRAYLMEKASANYGQPYAAKLFQIFID